MKKKIMSFLQRIDPVTRANRQLDNAKRQEAISIAHLDRANKQLAAARKVTLI